MTRISRRLNWCQSQGRTALVSFITAGDGGPQCTTETLKTLVDNGVDVLELGIPFSDPEAEGPSIQESSFRALQRNTTLKETLDIVREFRRYDPETPIVLMGYLNPILQFGDVAFSKAAVDAGVDGLIIVNLPTEERDLLSNVVSGGNLDLISLIAPTTDLERVRYILQYASGFIYYVSLKGITGASHIEIDSVREKVVSLKQETDLPVFVGFGIKTEEAAAQVAKFADGVVVGSAIVDTMASHDSVTTITAAISKQIQSIRRAIDASDNAY